MRSVAGSDPREIVRRGYDQVAEPYLEFTGPHIPTRLRWLRRAVPLIRPGSPVVDLGCGAMPATRELVEDHTLMGVDLSIEQLRMARRATGGRAALVLADITDFAVRPGSLGAVVSMWALLHVPRDAQRALFASVARWLEPSGVFLCSLGLTDDPGSVEDFLGSPMFFSHFDGASTTAMVGDAGLVVEEADEVEEPDGTRAPWVLARRPA